ncbi:MAG TPA: hypothetical protein VFQ61_23550, partial [Polyangiaceae bacterium]|nr:hypothetical protein [Polyangiaceae bacterium]
MATAWRSLERRCGWSQFFACSFDAPIGRTRPSQPSAKHDLLHRGGMKFYAYYADVPPEVLGELVHTAKLARLVTAGGSGPHLGLDPFLPLDAGFELHLNRTDEQISDLRESAACAIEIDEPLSVIPSHWIDPRTQASR